MADLNTSIRIAVLDSFSGPLRKMGLELTQVGDQAKLLKNRLEIAANLNQSAEGVGRFSDAIIGSLRKPVEDFASFDQALAKVSAKTGAMRGSGDFEALKEQATALGAQTKYSAEQVAAAQAEYAASGRNVQEILSSIPSTLSLATAGQIDLAAATQYTNETLNQFRLGAEQTAFVQDVLARADEVSAASITDLGEAFSYVGSTLASINVPIQEGAAYLSILADGGLKASRGGTMLQAMLSRLKAPSDEATKALRELGLSKKGIVELQKEIANGKLEAAFTKLATLSEKLTPEKRTRLMTEIFGQEGERAANVLLPRVLDQSDKGLRARLGQFEKVEGAVNRTAAIMEDSLAGNIERAGGALSGLSTTIGEVLKPTATSLAGTVEDVADGVRKLALEYPTATRASLELVAGLGGIALALKGVLVTQATYQAALGSLSTMYTTMSASLIGRAGLVAAVGAAGYAIGTWANETFGLSEKISTALGRGAPEQAKKGSQEQVYADGTIIDGKTGRVLQLGNGPGPAVVRDARAAGADSLDEINQFIQNRERGLAPFRVVGRERPQPTGAPFQPVSPMDDGAPGRGIVAPVAASMPIVFESATREQTDKLLQAMNRQERVAQATLDELKRTRRRPTSGGGTPSAEGAF